MVRLNSSNRRRNTQSSQNACQSNHNESHSQRTKTQLLAEDKEKFVINIVKYVLHMMGTKYPIKRTDIVKNILNNSGRHFEELIKVAQRQLIDTYGLELYEVPESKSNKQYIVVNSTDSMLIPSSQEEKTQYSLLLLVLAHIFMSGGSIPEVSVFNFLRKLNIVDGENYIHDYFGDVKNLVSVEFPKMLYLQSSKRQQTESQILNTQNGGVVFVSWGARALKEITKESVLAYVSKIYGRDMKTWRSLYRQIRQEQEQDGQNVNDSDSD